MYSRVTVFNNIVYLKDAKRLDTKSSIMRKKCNYLFVMNVN